MDALHETRTLGRVPVFIRTAKATKSYDKDKCVKKITDGFNLSSEILEINLRKIFSESIGNPLKKLEIRDSLNK